MNKSDEEIVEEFRAKKLEARNKLKALAVTNGTVVDAEAISEDWLRTALSEARADQDDKWLEALDMDLLNRLASEPMDAPLPLPKE